MSRRGLHEASLESALALMVDMPEHPGLKKAIRETHERGPVVGAVVTGQNPASAKGVAQKMFKLLETGRSA